MKLRKVLSAFAAAAVVASAISTSSFAATFNGSHTMKDGSWWTQDVIMGVESGIPVSNLIGDLDPSSVTSITFTSDTTFIVGYNAADGSWFQSDNSGVKEFTATNVLLESFTDAAGDKHDPYLHLCISKGDNVDYTINWTVNATDAPAEPETPAEPTAEPETPAEPTVEAETTAEATAEVDATVEVSVEATDEVEEPADVDVNEYFDGSTVYLVTDDGSANYVDASGVDLTSIYGVKFNVTFNDDELADDDVWVGGGVGANSNSTGWEQHEWGKASGEKEITPDFENGTITWFKGEPIFTDAEEYAQLWIQTWGGTVTVDSVELLYADYEDDTAVDATADAETPADDAASADKGNPDTGVAGVAVAAGVVALAGAAVVVSRKRK